ncbi:MAG: ferritin [Treponema sp.]|nr:ferritin [Treponema sp.]
MNEKISSLLNEQIQKEFESAYSYLGFASYFDSEGLAGFANWYKVQSKEETEHAMKFYKYLISRGQKVRLLDIKAPKEKLEGIEQILKLGLANEEYVTGLINDIYALAQKEQDWFTKNFLEWFVSEQFEEECAAHELLEKYRLFGKTGEGLYELNKELGKREE